MGVVDVVVGVGVVSGADEVVLSGAKFGGAVWLGDGDGFGVVVVGAVVAVVVPAPVAVADAGVITAVAPTCR